MNTSSAASQTPAPPALQEEQEDLRLGRRIATMGAIALVVVAYVLHAALPASPFRLPLIEKSVVQTILPEGFAFFTLSPRTPDVIAYGARPEGRWENLTLHAHSGWETAFGLNRRNRSQGTEMAIVANQLRPEMWSECNRAPFDCLNGLTPQHTVVNSASTKTLCGDVGLVMQEVLPWSWRDLATNMPSKLIRVNVTC